MFPRKTQKATHPPSRFRAPYFRLSDIFLRDESRRKLSRLAELLATGTGRLEVSKQARGLEY